MTERPSSESPAEPALELKEWASGLLGVPPGEDPEKTRERLISQIAIENFQPSEAWHEAIDAFLQPPAEFRWKDWPLFRREMETRLHTELLEFSERLFETSLEERSREWTRLCDRCQDFPVFERRLAALRPAIDFDASELPLLLIHGGELVRLALKLPPLSLPERTRSRIALIEQMGPEAYAWERAAREIQQKHPHIAELAPEFFSEVASLWSRHEAPGRWSPVTESRKSPRKRIREPALYEIRLSRTQALGLLCVIAAAVASTILALSK